MSKLKFKSWADSKVRSRKNLLKEKLLRKSLKWLFMVLRKHPIHIYQKALSKSGLFSYLAFFRGYYDASHILKLWCKIKKNYSTWEWAFWTLIYLLIINMFWTSALIFLFDFFLEARAEIQKYFRSFFGANENFKIWFRDLLTFNTWGN